MFGQELLSLCLAGVTRVTPDTLWQSWSFPPQVIAGLGFILVAGLLTSGRHAWLMGGWAVLAIALVSPLCRLSATLVSAHMVQFMLLVTVAPILLAASFRPPMRLVGSRFALNALAVGYGALIWLWHAPPVYAALLTNEALHVAGYAVIVSVSTVFWSAVIAALGRHEGTAVAALFATMTHTGILGALLTFSPRLLYPILAPGAADWSLTPLGDQQLAGLIMWVPGGAVYLAAGVTLCIIWLRRLDDTTSRRDSYERRST